MHRKEYKQLPRSNLAVSATSNKSRILLLMMMVIALVFFIRSFLAASFSNSSTTTTAVSSGTDGRFILRAPVNAAAEESMYDEVVIAAAGYETVTAQVDSNMNVTLDKVAGSTITGTVIAQRSLQPPVEIALSRQGTISLDHNGTVYRVGLHTNSRVIDASFDQPAKKVNIQLEGQHSVAEIRCRIRKGHEYWR